MPARSSTSRAARPAASPSTASGATDADTGITGYNYGAIAGSGWANAAGAFTFTAASPTGTSAVTATNGAGVTGASASFTAQSDSTAPAGGAFTANGTAATGGGSTSFLNSGTTLTINTRTDYTEAQTATASGLANSTLTMQTGTLSANACSAYGAPATIVGTTAQTVSTAHCYLLTLTGTDNVGNAASITTTVKVDTTAPTAPTGFAFSAPTNAYYPGAGSIVYTKGGSAGGFTVTASGATDADSGIAYLQLRRDRRIRLGQRRRRLHLHRRVAHRHRRSHRNQQRRPHRLQGHFHRPDATRLPRPAAPSRPTAPQRPAAAPRATSTAAPR